MRMLSACCVILVIIAFGLMASTGHAQSVVRWNAVELAPWPTARPIIPKPFKRPLDAAGKAGGGIVELPAGRYRVNGNLSIPAGVTLQGTYRVPPTTPSMTEKPDGTILLAYAGRGSQKGPPFIRLAGNNAAIAGLVVDYPEWKQTDVPPVPYPPCVESHDTENVGVTRLLLPQSLRGHQAGPRRPAPGPQRHRLSEQARHLRG